MTGDEEVEDTGYELGDNDQVREESMAGSSDLCLVSRAELLGSFCVLRGTRLGQTL